MPTDKIAIEKDNIYHLMRFVCDCKIRYPEYLLEWNEFEQRLGKASKHGILANMKMVRTQVAKEIGELFANSPDGTRDYEHFNSTVGTNNINRETPKR